MALISFISSALHYGGELFFLRVFVFSVFSLN